VKRGRLLAVIAANLLVLLALAAAYPSLMVSPGALMRGHASIEKDCFACHSPWRGAVSERCLKCHRIADIGLRTTEGVPLAQRKAKVSFHQDLIEQDCIACHSDHAGPKLTEHSRKPFSHSLLRPEVRNGCSGCHAAPADRVHRNLAAGCARCHQPERWNPANFDHSQLTADEQQHCEGCHKPPEDRTHRSIKGYCGQCHSPQHWRPATFDHDRLFALDADHDADCVTCHNADDYRRYTCYGCHAHRPDQIRAKHLDEGIGDFEDCVRCHKSASGEPEGGESRRGGERGD
jgi:hypothetical protein